MVWAAVVFEGKTNIAFVDGRMNADNCRNVSKGISCHLEKTVEDTF